MAYFARMLEADVFVVLDHVQYEQRGWQNRNRIRVKPGELLLTVPVRVRGRSRQAIRDVEIDTSQPWQRRHWTAIRHAYQSAPYFDCYRPALEQIYLQQTWERLADLNTALLQLVVHALGIDTPIVRSTTLNPTAHKTALLIELCQRLGATTLLTGQGATAYLDHALLTAHGIAHHDSTFKHPVYRQRYRPFMPRMASIDLLFNCGHQAGQIVRQSVAQPPTPRARHARRARPATSRGPIA